MDSTFAAGTRTNLASRCHYLTHLSSPLPPSFTVWPCVSAWPFLTPLSTGPSLYPTASLPPSLPLISSSTTPSPRSPLFPRSPLLSGTSMPPVPGRSTTLPCSLGSSAASLSWPHWWTPAWCTSRMGWSTHHPTWSSSRWGGAGSTSRAQAAGTRSAVHCTLSLHAERAAIALVSHTPCIPAFCAFNRANRIAHGLACLAD